MTKKNISVAPQKLRMNNKVISSATEPIYTKVVNPATSVISTASYQCTLGNLYTASITTVQTLTKNNFFTFRIVNPSNSGKSIYLYQFYGYDTTNSNTGYLQADIYADAVMSTAWLNPKSITPTNRNFSHSGGSISNVYYLNNTTTTISSGTIISTSLQVAAIPVITYTLNGDIIVPPGHSFTILITNNTSGDSSIMCAVSWWET
ncbi:hypothetical protein [Pelosinus sp. sgz500959]|uniref:hypothetical protein n=1 Tax=Pelosinus sp. sgz500959 TaxID=3242472 RepID=UPI00366B6852